MTTAIAPAVRRLLAGEVVDDVTEVGLERAEIHTRDRRTDHPDVDHHTIWSSTLRAPAGEVLEPGELADERELDDAGRAVALLGDDQLRHALRSVGGWLLSMYMSSR